MEKTEQLKKINSDAYAHGNWHWLFISFWWDKKLITEEEKNKAFSLLSELKKEKIKSLKPWQLVFVGMGMTNDTDIGNYRIRTEIERKDGKRFFVEISSNDKKIFIDHSINRDMEFEYKFKISKLLEKWINNRTKEDKEDYKYFSHQPYERHRIDEARERLKDKKPTKQNVLDFVNFLFKTNFLSIEVDNYLLTTDDYTSKDL